MTRYATGRRFEYKVRKDLEQRGYYVERSAASKGAVDLFALGQQEILLVQCKQDGTLPAQEWNLLLSLARRADAPACNVLPILAQPEKQGRSVKIAYWELCDQRTYNQAPMTRFEPGGRDER